MSRYLTLEEVEFFNRHLINMISPDEQQGIKHRDLLESAVMRPQATYGGDDLYPTVFMKAAALMESLAQNHAFYNANKRTAWSAAVTFLKLNGYNLTVSHDAAVQYTLDVTNRKIDLQRSAEFIEAHCTARQ